MTDKKQEAKEELFEKWFDDNYVYKADKGSRAQFNIFKETKRSDFKSIRVAALKEVVRVHKEAWDVGNPLSPKELSERLGVKME